MLHFKPAKGIDEWCQVRLLLTYVMGADSSLSFSTH